MEGEVCVVYHDLADEDKLYVVDNRALAQGIRIAEGCEEIAIAMSSDVDSLEEEMWDEMCETVLIAAATGKFHSDCFELDKDEEEEEDKKEEEEDKKSNVEKKSKSGKSKRDQVKVKSANKLKGDNGAAKIKGKNVKSKNSVGKKGEDKDEDEEEVQFIGEKRKRGEAGQKKSKKTKLTSAESGSRE